MKFKKYTVEELVQKNMLEKPLDGNHGNKHPKSSDYTEQGIPFIMVSDISNGRINYNTCKFISKKQRDTLDKGFSKEGDVLLSHKATIGITCIVDNEYPEIVITPQLTYYRVKKDINNYYLKYYFDSPYFQHILKNWATSGSTRAYLGITAQLKLPILLPDIIIQNKIATMLQTIDRKIELNNQINDNLYNIGASIYNEKIVKNGLSRKLKQFFEVVTGKKDANAGNKNGIYPFFTCSKQISRINEYSFDAPAILLAGNGEFNVKIYKGKFDAYQRTYVLIPNNEFYLGYLYFAISENLYDLTSGFRGSVIKFITKGMIENYKIPFIYDENVYKCLNNLINEIRKNSVENENLSKLRDTLLQKLMNGEIDLDKLEI